MIQHVTREIPPSQLEACVHFYGLLGMQPVSVPASIGDRAVWLAPVGSGGAVQLHLMPTADARPTAGHVAFVVSDYEAESRREHWGSPRAYVTDPAANIVELMARAPDDQ
jgi:catechol 2,3-dioxygenase-like lactoylglutathione lyase family enzyme